MQQRLKQALAQRQKRYIVNPNLIRAAVLLPIFNRQGHCYLLFTKRTQEVNTHKSQISFPGGAYEETDNTLVATALRECNEEIGLAANDAEVLGELDDFVAQVSNYIITPFVAIIPWPYQFKVNNKEVEAIIEIPISALLKLGRLNPETRTIDNQEITSLFYPYQGKIIWGATARILNQFLDILAGVIKDAG